MSVFWIPIVMILELVAAGGVIYGFAHEDKLIALEKKLFGGKKR